MGKHGALEQQVMDTLWDRGEASVRQVMVRLGGTLAYTTVMTVLDRLHNKGRVTRRKEGLAWRYRAAAPREQVLGALAADLLTGEGEAEPLLAAFIDHAEELDPQVLDTLERMIRQRRGGK